jgi:Protein of unknown function VcgC/VcgE (DUF2780)
MKRVRFLTIGSFACALVGLNACSSTSSTTASSTPPPSGTTTSGAATPGTAASGTATSGTAASGTAMSGAATSAPGVGLTDVLGKSLGLTGDQASGAVGSYLSYTQNKLSPTDYTKVAAVVPGSEQYVQKAKDLGAVSSGGITDASALNAAYEKLGISPEVASKITPTVTNYIGKVGGSTVQSLLSSVLQ